MILPSNHQQDGKTSHLPKCLGYLESGYGDINPTPVLTPETSGIGTENVSVSFYPTVSQSGRRPNEAPWKTRVFYSFLSPALTTSMSRVDANVSRCHICLRCPPWKKFVSHVMQVAKRPQALILVGVQHVVLTNLLVEARQISWSDVVAIWKDVMYSDPSLKP